MTGLIGAFAVEHRSAMNSVWPGKENPVWYKTDLLMGLVTAAAASPERQRSVARRMLCVIASANSGLGLPGMSDAPASSSIGRTGRAPPNRSAASNGFEMIATGSEGSKIRGSAITKKGDNASSRRAFQGNCVIWGPQPAGSPIVTARGLRARGMSD